MIAFHKRGSSSVTQNSTSQFVIHEDESDNSCAQSESLPKNADAFKSTASNVEIMLPLTTSKLENQQTPTLSDSSTCAKNLAEKGQSRNEASDEMKKNELQLPVHTYGTSRHSRNIYGGGDDRGMELEPTSKMDERLMASESSSFWPPFHYGAGWDTKQSKAQISEVERLKMELEVAKEQIATMNQQHNAKLRSNGAPATNQDTILLSANNNNDFATPRPGPLMTTILGSEDLESKFRYWNLTDDSSRRAVTQQPQATFDHHQHMWPNLHKKRSSSAAEFQGIQDFPTMESTWNKAMLEPWNRRGGTQAVTSQRNISSPQARKPSNLRVDTLDFGPPYIGSPSTDQGYQPPSLVTNRTGSTIQNRGIWNQYSTSSVPSLNFSPPLTPMAMEFPVTAASSGKFTPRPIGAQLSPTASEFNAPWNHDPRENSTCYVPLVEPMNYRRLLDRNMSCNWKYIVDKIVCSNDQQASIFLQQKLKVATPEQKYEMIEAIASQAYPLMVNRFGNFLIQRCLEHGTPDQIVAIANTIRGNTLALSMDAFGCHVIQKAFDVVPEEYKAIMVHELLRRIPETVIHRYACHVWQKLFELRWSDSPPQIMKYVNEALRGMWHEVALGETGSLVVQNIFENCLEEDKRPCINEVLASIDIISHGQFGNWCIQHICEHGALPDQRRATEHVVRFATEYSMDQFASKVVEKCLKVGGSDFLDRYLDRVCEARSDRPRMSLIDIAGDQYGNYLVQWILLNASPSHRELVAQHIRKHMVSLRGSKFGSRVAMLCCNNSVTTRPGHASALNASRYSMSNNAARSTYSSGYF